MLKRRGKGSPNWARGVFAAFWIVLAGVSGVYLFSAFTDPTLGGQLVQLNPLPGGASSGETTSAVSGGQSSGARDQELAEIKASLRELSQQVAELSSRLSPAEKSADASKPAPSTPPAPEPPASVAAAPPPPEPAEDVKPPEPKPAQAEAPKPAETPAPEAKPIEQAAVDVKPPAPQETTPAPKPSEPPAVVVSPLEEPPAEETAEPSSDVSAPTPPPPAAEEAQTPAPSPPPPAATESAALDPVALPPAANDGSTRYGIEIGIVPKQDGLRPLWREYLTNHAALVAGLQPRRVLAPDKKWRLIAGPFASAAEAGQACALFKKASRPCEATVYAGDGL
jgi:hypothetical protein